MSLNLAQLGGTSFITYPPSAYHWHILTKRLTGCSSFPIRHSGFRNETRLCTHLTINNFVRWLQSSLRVTPLLRLYERTTLMTTGPVGSRLTCNQKRDQRGQHRQDVNGIPAKPPMTSKQDYRHALVGVF